MCLGLVGAVVLASGSLPKAIAMIILGLLLGMVGTDVNSGVARFDFGVPELQDGIDFAIVAMGVFGFAEIMTNLEQKENRVDITDKIGSLYPNKQEFRNRIPRCSAARPWALRWASCRAVAPCCRRSRRTRWKRRSRAIRNASAGPSGRPGRPESANNAAAQTSFIPLLTLGIPGNAVMALMVGAMTIHNIQPGPQVMTSHPQLFWGLIASMWIGNLMLVVLNLPLIGLWVKLLKVPYRILFPAILVFCTIGVYSLNYNPFDVFTTAMFGIVGYVWSKLKCEGAPLLLGLVLGPMMEENFRRALLLSRGDFTTFITRPLSASLLAIAVFLVILVALPAIRKKREQTFVED